MTREKFTFIELETQRYRSKQLKHEKEDHSIANMHNFVHAECGEVPESTGNRCHGAVNEDVAGEGLELEDNQVEGERVQGPDD